ncbi:MAG TPA: NADH-quinone oxidoreductase subunit NuoE [Dehalococcoidales bacterium]|nr:NADH-quinone oxidoreductase subunit NuoE [Dehalococcoidales bacterium]
MSSGVDLVPLAPVLRNYREQATSLISMLQEIQKIYSYLPEDVLKHLSQETMIPMSRIYAVATFYAQFYLKQRGRKVVRVCRGTACHVRGSSLVLNAVERELGIKDGETTPDFEYTLETVACIGACALAPAIVINENTYGKMTPSEAAKLVSRKEKKE